MVAQTLEGTYPNVYVYAFVSKIPLEKKKRALSLPFTHRKLWSKI